LSSFPLASWLVGALEDEGLTVKTVAGWKLRGYQARTFDPKGLVFHHTASAKNSGNAPSLTVVTKGRADLPGPLCNVLVGRDGTAYVVAAGYANHAGAGGPFKTIPKDSGNKYLIGVEVENNGIGEAWTEELQDAVARVMAACLKHLGRGAEWEIGHKEWAPDRKIDPHPIDMDKARARTTAILQGGDDMDSKELRAIFGFTEDSAKGVGSVLEGVWDYCRDRVVDEDNPITDPIRAKAYNLAKKLDEA
jgi:N-acetylmuramoyl-L-alanine amidase-like protein